MKYTNLVQVRVPEETYSALIAFKNAKAYTNIADALRELLSMSIASVKVKPKKRTKV